MTPDSFHKRGVCNWIWWGFRPTFGGARNPHINLSTFIRPKAPGPFDGRLLDPSIGHPATPRFSKPGGFIGPQINRSRAPLNRLIGRVSKSNQKHRATNLDALARHRARKTCRPSWLLQEPWECQARGPKEAEIQERGGKNSQTTPAFEGHQESSPTPSRVMLSAPKMAWYIHHGPFTQPPIWRKWLAVPPEGSW